MPTSSTTFVPLFAIEKAVRRGRTEQAAALTERAIGILTRLPHRLRRLLGVWNMRLHDRAFLATLPDHQLGDMGMTRGERDHEVSKPFWED